MASKLKEIGLLSLKQVADELEILTGDHHSERYVRELITMRGMKARKLGGRYFVVEQNLVEWLLSGETE